jgi:RNA polymerase sigma-70 factor (ECF subfamily)
LSRYASFSSEELVAACAGSRDTAAWEEFIRRFHPVIAGVILRTARRWGEPPRNLLDDLIQETFLKLCDENSRLLASFVSRHEGAIYGFLKVVAANTVRDHFKRDLAEKRGAGQTQSISEMDWPEAKAASQSFLSAAELHVFKQQIDEALIRLFPGKNQRRNRDIFWLHYQQGLSASAIASLPAIGLDTKGVESTLRRMICMIRSHILETKHGSNSEGIGQANSL